MKYLFLLFCMFASVVTNAFISPTNTFATHSVNSGIATVCLSTNISLIQAGNSLDSMVITSVSNNMNVTTYNVTAYTTVPSTCAVIQIVVPLSNTVCASIPTIGVLPTVDINVTQVQLPICSAGLINTVAVGLVPTIPTSSCVANFVATNNGPNYLFNNQSTTSFGYSSLWIFGDGTSSNINTPNHTYNSVGTYTVCLIITDTITLCSDTTCQTISVGSNPCSFFLNTSVTVNGNNAYFFNTSNSFGNIYYSYYFGDGQFLTSNQSTNLHNYVNAGTYTYFIIAIDSLTSPCSDTTYGTIVINGNTPCNLVISNTTTTNGLNATFNVVSNNNINSLNMFTYFPGDGNIITNNNSNYTHTYLNAGTYNYCISMVDTAGCIDTTCGSIVINSPVCNASFTSMANGCNGVFVNTSQANYLSAIWYWGDGTSTVNNNATVIHTFPSSNTYTNYLIVNWNNNGVGCSDTFWSSISIVCPTTCTAMFTHTIGNNTVSFSNNSTVNFGFNSKWNFGDGSPISLQYSPIHTYATSGTYNVCLYLFDTLTNIICDSVCNTIVIAPNNLPCNASFSSTTNGCNGIFVNTSGVNYTSATWYFGDGTVVTNNNSTVVHTYNQSGIYTAYLIASWSANGVICTDTFYDSVYILCPSTGCNANFTNSINGNIATFINQSNSTTASYNWYFGDGTTSTAINPLHSYAQNGTYVVCLVMIDSTTSGLCIDSFCNTITIGTGGTGCVANFIATSTGLNASFANTSTINGGSFNCAWYFGDGFTSTLTSPNHTYITAGVYTVCLVIVSSNGCLDSFCNVVTVANPNTPCTASFTSSVQNCIVTFTNTSMGSYNIGAWVNGNGTFAVLAGTTHTLAYSSNGTYNVCLFISDSLGICSDTFCQAVTVFNCPTGLSALPLTNYISISPNPTKGLLLIENQSNEALKLNVYNSIGQLMLNKQLNSNTNQVNIELLPVGMYTFILENKIGERVIQKVVKQ